MQGTIHRSLRTGLLGVGWALVAATASAGPIILGGDDLTHHGSTSAGQVFDGWLYIQRALENIAPAVTIANDGSVAVLGSADSMATTNDAGAAYHFAVPLAAATTPLSGGAVTSRPTRPPGCSPATPVPRPSRQKGWTKKEDSSCRGS